MTHQKWCIVQPKLTTIKQDTAEIGTIAARQLIRLIEDPKSTLIEKIVVLDGASVKNI